MKTSRLHTAWQLRMVQIDIFNQRKQERFCCKHFPAHGGIWVASEANRDAEAAKWILTAK